MPQSIIELLEMLRVTTEVVNRHLPDNKDIQIFVQVPHDQFLGFANEYPLAQISREPLLEYAIGKSKLFLTSEDAIILAAQNDTNG